VTGADTAMRGDPANEALPASHLLVALAVVAIWGTNFVVIHQGLAQFPPLTFATLRFFLASVPLLAFVSRPRMPLTRVALYGLLVGTGQFGLMLYAMDGRISPGLASVLIQTQAFFTVALALAVAGERLSVRGFAGLALCATGVLVATAFTGGENSVFGVVLVLGAAFAWGAANIVARTAGRVNALALVVWSNVFAVPPLLIAAWFFEGHDRISQAFAEATPSGWATVLWQAFGNAIIGYAAWNWLLGRHPASQVAPLGLLVPVFGLGASVGIWLNRCHGGSCWPLPPSWPAWR
jgi:O-acetylserine/cysteine efflux transporter